MKSRTLLFLVLAAGLALAPLGVGAQAADPQATWTALGQASFDPQKVATVSNLVLQRDLARLILRSGTLGFAQPVNGRVLQAAFRGSGSLSLGPKLPLEIQQLKFHTGAEEFQVDFSEAVFIFSDSTYDDIAAQVQLGAGDAAGLQKLYADRNQKLTYYGLNYEPRLLRGLFSSQPEKYAFFHAELKTDKYGWLWLDLDATRLEEVSLAQFDESRYAFNTWCSFPAGGRTPQEVWQKPDAKYDMVTQSYNLDITVEKDATLRGVARVTFLPRAPVRVLELALDPNLRVEQVADSTGAALTFFQPRDPKGRFTQFGNALTVALAQEAPAGQPFELTFRYAGKHVVTKEGSGVFFASSYGWYPTLGGAGFTIDDFIFRYPFDFTLRVPKNYDAVAVGNKTDERKEGDYKITRWVTDVPVAVAGFAFGNYFIREQTLPNGTSVQVYVNRNPDKFIRDLQNIAGVEGMQIVEDPSGQGRGTGEGYGRTTDPRLAALESLNPARFGGTILTEVSNSLKVFEAYFGPYPYKKLAVSNIPLDYGYGQGWPGLLYVSSLTFIDSTQRHVLFGGRLSAREQVNITDRFRAHETSHQWWGHVVGWKSYHDQWLSEGFAEFSGLLYAQLRSGTQEFFSGLRGGREELLSKDPEGAVYDDLGPIYAGVRLSSGKHPRGYQTVIYTKGGWVLHMLRMMMFDPRAPDPEARFKAMMQDFTKTYYNQPASTGDFKRVVEKYMTPEMQMAGGGTMDWFFNAWVYGTGIPHYTVSYTIEPQPQGVRLRGSIKQSRVAPSFAMLVPIYATMGTQVARLGWIKVTGAETPFDVNLPMAIDKITLNEWEDVLSTVEYK